MSVKAMPAPISAILMESLERRVGAHLSKTWGGVGCQMRLWSLSPSTHRVESPFENSKTQNPATP